MRTEILDLCGRDLAFLGGLILFIVTLVAVAAFERGREWERRRNAAFCQLMDDFAVREAEELVHMGRN